MQLEKQPKCKNCFDKGFSTEYKGRTGNSRYTFDEGGVKINYCACKKGKRLKHRAEQKLVSLTK